MIAIVVAAFVLGAVAGHYAYDLLVWILRKMLPSWGGRGL